MGTEQQGDGDWTERHEELVDASAPATYDPTAAEVTRVWNRVAGTLEAERPQSVRRRRWVAAGVAAVVLGGAGVAAAGAGVFSARTGEGPSSAEDLLLGGPGENLDPGAPDFAEVVAEEIRDIPFPDERTRRIAVNAQLPRTPLTGQAGGIDGYGYTRTGILRSEGAISAICAWTNQWAAATASGDTAARDTAAQQVREAGDWPAVTDMVRSQQDPVEGNFVPLPDLALAVTAGDREGAAAALLELGCPGGLLPDLPEADQEVVAQQHAPKATRP